MIARRNMITSILESMEGIDQDMFEITNEQWKIMEDIVNVLEPFKVTIMTLSEEKMPLISLLKPLLWQLVSSHLKVKELDSDTAKTFKESLSDMLCDRYADYNVTLLLQIATTLDPRYYHKEIFKLCANILILYIFNSETGYGLFIYFILFHSYPTTL